MPPKKRQRQGITNSDTIAALNRVSSANTFSRGAIEALRLCHARFILMLGLELSVLCSDDAIVTLQPSHVDECLEKLKLTHYKPQIAKSDNKKEAAAPFVSKKRRKQKGRKQWSAELQQEQETLLAQSKQTMQEQQQLKK